MAWTCDEVLSKLGDKAQVAASGIIAMVYDEELKRPVHTLVGTFDNDSFNLTDAGKALMRGKPDVVEAEVVSEKKRGVKKPTKVEPVVEDSNELIDDLDLDV